MEGEWLERLGYLTTEFQRPRSRRDNAARRIRSFSPRVATPRAPQLSVPPRDERGTAASSNSPPPYYMQKRENAGKHDRIKAATNFNADWVLIAYVSILGAPARCIRTGTQTISPGSATSSDIHDKARGIALLKIRISNYDVSIRRSVRISTIIIHLLTYVIRFISPRMRRTDPPFFHFSNFTYALNRYTLIIF